jgi:hypothetical protein
MWLLNIRTGKFVHFYFKKPLSHTSVDVKAAFLTPQYFLDF